MKILKILFPIIMFTVLFSCDKIEVPLKEQDGTCGDATIKPIKKILIEDYTGHKCNNCPEAAEILHEIKEDYCDYVIPIAIHVSGFAAPSGSTFVNDYRTEAGEELNTFFGVSSQGLPNGLVARTLFNENIVIGKDDWRAALDTLRKATPEVNIIINSSYDEDLKKITANIAVEILQDITHKFNLALYVTEDNIISPQTFPDTIIQNYVHRHMLRKAVNGAFGRNLVSSASSGDIIEKSFTFIANEEWNISNIELVAFISNSETKEIIQAESEHLEH